jgi:tyrosine-protein phosphatase SIW14
MKQEKHYKTKYIKLLYFTILPVIVIVLTGVYLMSEYGLSFDPLLGNNQHRAEPIGAHEKWAERIELPGLPNFHKVSDDLYRGAQPSVEGMKQLEKIGVKTVVNLRYSHSDRDELQGTALAYKHIEMTAWGIPENEDILRFLQIVSDSNSLPVFVHCQYGADRTGTMCAVYRIIIQGWSKDEAIEEMTKGGFGYHSIWQNLPNYIRNINVQEIKQEASSNP